MSTQILTTCDGKINQHGFCDKCYQPAHTTSNQCGRLVPSEQLQKHVVMGWPPDHKTIRAAAIAHMESECTNGFIDDQMKRYCTKDFIAGAEWALSQAACP